MEGVGIHCRSTDPPTAGDDSEGLCGGLLPLRLAWHVLSHDAVAPDSTSSEGPPMAASGAFQREEFAETKRQKTAAPCPRWGGCSLLSLWPPHPFPGAPLTPEVGTQKRAVLENTGVRISGRDVKYERVLLTPSKMWVARSCRGF